MLLSFLYTHSLFHKYTHTRTRKRTYHDFLAKLSPSLATSSLDFLSPLYGTLRGSVNARVTSLTMCMCHASLVYSHGCFKISLIPLLWEVKLSDMGNIINILHRKVTYANMLNVYTQPGKTSCITFALIANLNLQCMLFA